MSPLWWFVLFCVADQVNLKLNGVTGGYLYYVNRYPFSKLPSEKEIKKPIWSFRGRLRGGMVQNPNIKSDTKMADDQWFDQILDHFSPSYSTWKQRYFVNKAFYKRGGPVFLMIGGEGTASPSWLISGQWIKYAKTYSALCFMVEHRFYGKSHPTIDTSSENLQYLSSKQALADLANFISNMTITYHLKGAKWIAFGGSYSGALATWLRYKYPHLVHGAVASSGPIRASFNFEEYLAIVGYNFGNFSQSCFDNIQNGINSIASYLILEEKRALLKNMFNLCSDIDPKNSEDIMTLYEMIADMFATVVQYDKPINHLMRPRTQNINQTCAIMTNTSLGRAIYRVAEVIKKQQMFHDEDCFDFSYRSLIQKLSLYNWDSEANEGARQWLYQTCTEFAYFQTSSDVNQPFGDFFPLNYFVQMCSDMFSRSINSDFISRRVNDTNIMNGGLSPKVTNIVFPNGSEDPWHALSPLANLSSNATAIYIKGTSHCADMYDDDPTDSPQLIQARKTIDLLIKGWLL